jgi:hypothetical protein
MIIDADSHVEESEAMFDRIDNEFRRQRTPVRKIMSGTRFTDELDRSGFIDALYRQ